MLLVHQVGSVKNGEVVRFTLTYVPSADRILPTPSHLHLKIRNTSAIAFRAAYLHGPYTLHVSAHPSVWKPYQELDSPRRDGVPQYEPNLKAGGSWTAKLRVPDDIRETVETFTQADKQPLVPRSVTWVIEISSQIIFSDSASVSYDVLVGRDAASLDLALPSANSEQSVPVGQLSDQRQNHRRGPLSPGHPNGVFSDAVQLVVDDTESLWNTPRLPDSGPHEEDTRLQRELAGKVPENQPEKGKRGSQQAAKPLVAESQETSNTTTEKKPGKPRIHLVILTHGLHSNLGADMLYLKESIDIAAKQARLDATMRKAKARSRVADNAPAESSAQGNAQDSSFEARSPLDSRDEPIIAHHSELEGQDAAEEDLDQVIVRGFAGNAIRTERGIKYLGKRLAHYVLSMTYPSQPFYPIKKSFSERYAWPVRSTAEQSPKSVHKGSHIVKEVIHPDRIPYKVTSISFIGHSLGGLIQTYAVAYIQKHSPTFFSEIKPINFVALASPFLGLSNENPMYVKFALDFGLVGRTGQDLGLTWRAPNLARTGWAAMVGGLGERPRTQDGHDPRAKPLLRVLPTGPAHVALKKFKNRTVYANVVNDGIVPTRTSSLLFLDWRGLEKVEKARREFGLVGTAVEWGWSELTGASSRQTDSSKWLDGADSDDEESGNPSDREQEVVPQPTDSGKDYDSLSLRPRSKDSGSSSSGSSRARPTPKPISAFANFLKMFQLHGDKEKPPTKKQAMLNDRSQTTQSFADGSGESGVVKDGTATASRPSATSGESYIDASGQVMTPPSTSIFESASYLINPPLPKTDFLIDPSIRPRTIFHDRVYHPDDIPPAKPTMEEGEPHRRGKSLDIEPVVIRKSTESRRSIAKGNENHMQVEERIARAYHRDMAWRKVLVRLEPDAHNNIIVRRKFANAYGWPVIKHLVDTHFADTITATTADDLEDSRDRARDLTKGPKSDGTEVHEAEVSAKASSPDDPSQARRSNAGSQQSEQQHRLGESAAKKEMTKRTPTDDSWDSAAGWSDMYYEDEDDEEDDMAESHRKMGVGQIHPWLGHPPKLQEMPNQTNQAFV